MSGRPGAHGLAALSICEALLLSLTDNKIIDAAEAKGILSDAATAHRGEAASVTEGSKDAHKEAAALIEAIRDGGNSVRRRRPAPGTRGEGAASSLDGDGADPDAS